MSYFRTLLVASLLTTLSMGVHAAETKITKDIQRAKAWQNEGGAVNINEATIAIALTAQSNKRDDFESAGNYRPEVDAKLNVGLAGNLLQFAVGIIQEDTLDTAGEQTFDEEWAKEVFKELNASLNVGGLKVLVGDHAAIETDIGESNDIRLRDAKIYETPKAYGSVSGVKVIVSEGTQLSAKGIKAVDAINHVLQNVSLSVTYFNGNNRDDLLNFDDLNSWALNSTISLGDIALKVSYVDAQTLTGEETVYVFGAEAYAPTGLKLYGEYQDFKQSGNSDYETKVMLGVSKDFTGRMFPKGTSLEKAIALLATKTIFSTEYTRTENNGVKYPLKPRFTENVSLNMTRQFNGIFSVGAQLDHELDKEEDATTFKVKTSIRF